MAVIGQPITYTPDGVIRQAGLVVANLTEGSVDPTTKAMTAGMADIVIFADGKMTFLLAVPEDNTASAAAKTWMVV